jgi:hypothetical protein
LCSAAWRNCAKRACHHISRNLIGNYVTSLEMAGCSLTLLAVDDELLRLVGCAGPHAGAALVIALFSPFGNGDNVMTAPAESREDKKLQMTRDQF